MGITVNGVEIEDAAIEHELPNHGKADNPLKQTVHELVLRTLLLQEANQKGIDPLADADARIEALIAREVQVPAVDDESCAAYYRGQTQRFRSGELVEVRHILFQVTPAVPLDLLRDIGQTVLEELRLYPERFAERAREYSNCPSGEHGGNLGVLSRGETVPEFEDFVFRLPEGALAERLLETRFGLHIVQVLRRVEGQRIPFDAVKAQIADYLSRQAWQRAIYQYLRILVGRADIRGVTLDGADTPLVQ